MIKKEYIQPEVKEIKVNIAPVLAALSGEGNVPEVEEEEFFDDEGDI